MKIYRYDCEYCDFMTNSFDNMLEHEAKHLNLTVDEYKHWYQLYKAYMQAMNNMRPGCHIDQELEYHNAAAEFHDFTENHNLKVPEHFEIFTRM